MKYAILYTTIIFFILLTGGEEPFLKISFNRLILNLRNPVNRNSLNNGSLMLLSGDFNFPNCKIEFQLSQSCSSPNNRKQMRIHAGINPKKSPIKVSAKSLPVSQRYEQNSVVILQLMIGRKVYYFSVKKNLV